MHPSANRLGSNAAHTTKRVLLFLRFLPRGTLSSFPLATGGRSLLPVERQALVRAPETLPQSRAWHHHGEL